MEVEGVALGGSFFGIFSRTILAYWKARREARALDPSQPFEFDREYLGTAIFSAAGAAVASILGFPLLMQGLPAGGSVFAVFAYAFSFGWFANDATNMLISVGQSTIRVAKNEVAEVKQFLTSKRLSKE